MDLVSETLQGGFCVDTVEHPNPGFIIMSKFIRKKDLDFIQSISHCMYCGSKENLTIDHIVAVSKGGNGKPDNLTRSCQKCNSSKSDKTIHDWEHHLKNKLNHHLEAVYYCMDVIHCLEHENYKINSDAKKIS